MLLSEANYSLTFGYAHSPLRLGDLLFIASTPITSYLCTNFSKGQIFWRTLFAQVDVPRSQSRISPEFIVYGVIYYSPNADAYNLPINYRWSGFSRWANVSDSCP
jgi:hypothetical protein